MSESASQSVSQSVGQSVSQSVSQGVSQSVSQGISQSVSQSVTRLSLKTAGPQHEQQTAAKQLQTKSGKVARRQRRLRPVLCHRLDRDQWYVRWRAHALGGVGKGICLD